MKAGDYALIVGCRENTANIGKGCELVEIVTPGQIFTRPDGSKARLGGDKPAWLVFGPELLTTYAGDGRLVAGDHALVQQKHLMPLRPDSDQQRSELIPPALLAIKFEQVIQ